MSKSRKPGAAGAGRNRTSLLYTEQRKRTYEFAATRRKVRIGDSTKSMTSFEIMELKQYELGVAGNSIAQRDYLLRAELAEEARRAHVEADCLYWSAMKARNQRAIDQARAAGTPLPRVLPHPDDVVIDWENGPKFLGPRVEQEYASYKQAADLRDLLYLQQAMEDALDGVPMRHRPRQDGALIQAMVLNQMMAPSLKLSEDQEFHRICHLKYLPQRQLLKDCRIAWRKFGAVAPRGRRYGTLEALGPMLRTLAGVIKAHQAVEDDPLCYEEAIQTAAEAAGAFIASARAKENKSNGTNKKIGDVA